MGTRFAYDGEIVEVIEMHTVAGMPEVLTLRNKLDLLRCT